MERASETADAPPRERTVDLVRAVSIAAVVLGHWTVVAVTEADGTLDGVNALGRLGWLHPLTWLFQVMPLFFITGGFANATSLDRHRAAGGDVPAWITRRYRRLLWPATALLVFVVAGFVAARALGVDAEMAGTAAWLATVPLWFLAAYLAAVALAPATLALHRRIGLAAPAAGAVVIAASDVARITDVGVPASNVSWLLGWLVVHQLGYAWQEGRLPSVPHVGAPMAAAGVVLLVVLTVVGPYPVSMVRAPGDELHNTDPPTIALLVLAVAQLGVVLAVRDRADRWLQHPRRWERVRRVQAVTLTLFLWHMTAALVGAVALYATGILPVVPLDSGRWLLLRMPWLLTCGAALLALVAAFAPLERRAREHPRGGRVERGLAVVAAALGAVGALVGMLGIALAGSGSHGPLGLPTWSVVAYAVGVAGIAAARASTTEAAPASAGATGAASRWRS